MASRRAPGLTHLLEVAPPRRGRWELAALVTSTAECADADAARAAGLPVLLHDIRAFYAARGARLTDLSHRAEFDGCTAALLRPHRPDLVVLCGYLHILTAPMLDAFPGRIVNVHDADLGVLGADGLPRYRGLRSTRDAIFAGAVETRSTVHLVTAEVDIGPPLVRSWAFPVHKMARDALERGAEGTTLLKAYAYAQREWMMGTAWGPMLARTIELFAGGAVRQLGGRVVVGNALGPLELTAPAGQAVARPAAFGD